MLRRDAGAVLSLLLAVAAARESWVRYPASGAIDFYQFWAVAQAAGEVRDPYSPEARGSLARIPLDASPSQREVGQRRPVLETYSTPLLYAVFRAISSGDYDLDYLIYHLLSLACTAAAVLGLCVLFGWSAATALLALSALLLFASPFASDSVVGNVNQLQLAGLASLIALMHREKAVASGAVAALLVLFKPNLVAAEALLLVALLAHGRLRFAARHLAG